MTHNHSNFQNRLDFIRDLLRSLFNVERANIEPIAYNATVPFKANNFIYHITLPQDVTLKLKNDLNQPGVVDIPEDAKGFVLRLSNNDAEDMSRYTRIENEVAIISLAAAAFKDFDPPIVPSVYAWASAAPPSQQGWILQELMPGVPVDESFEKMSMDDKRSILAQMAKILKALQEFEVPDSVEDFGGVTFDNQGRIVSAAMTMVGTGPWPTYEAYVMDIFEQALQTADGNPYIKGWDATGVRVRMETFVTNGLLAQLQVLEDKHDKCIVHSDFTTNNLHYDPQTHQITALLDYDFASILHPSWEFFRSFSTNGGRLTGWSTHESEETLRNAKLHGFPKVPPLLDDVDEETKTKWELAQIWEEELEKLDVKRPRTMKGIEQLADVVTLLDLVLPWRITNADVLLLQSEDVILKYRDETETKLVKMLEHLGF